MIEHTTIVRVRYRDTDQMGVVYHGVYLEYFETGRTELLRASGLPYSSIEQQEGVMLPVLSVGITIKRPAKYDDLLTVTAQVSPIVGARLVIKYRVERKGILLVEGETTHAFVESGSMRPLRPPKRIAEALGQD